MQHSTRLAFVVSMLIIVGCTQQNDDTGAIQQTAKVKAQAQKQYTELCAACHGSQARGGVGPDLSASRYEYGKNRSAIVKTIMDGRPGGMPAFGSHLKPEEAVVLAEYLLSL